MYTASAIRFRDPFVSKDIPLPPSSLDSYHLGSAVNAPSSFKHHDLGRPLTPLPEMNGLPTQSKAIHYAQESGVHYGSGTQQDHSCYRPSAAGPLSMHNPSATARPYSPRQESRRSTVDMSSSRRNSQVTTIATNFQIPRSVNDSGGSLSELAAQITCLFWFESSDLLQQIENSPVPLQATRPLVPDAKPTTGFRKWVTTILSTTCVAQNVVLLALLFIHRLKKLNPSVNGKPGSEYRLLTVALMLGNKFLDDNTYTNKTWAEVSGINVGEVHIMEVEFLSNMKYCLFTSEQDWARWQTLLGKFASYFDRASRPQPAPLPAPILPPASSLHLPLALPSPPASNQASPPYVAEQGSQGVCYGSVTQTGPTPAPSPLGNPLDSVAGPSPPRARKRSCYDEAITEPPSKRLAHNVSTYTSPQRYATMPMPADQIQSVSRLPLPALPLPGSQAPSSSFATPLRSGQQLPPLNIPARAMAMIYPNTTVPAQLPPVTTSAAPATQLVHTPAHVHPQSVPSFPGSGTASPTPLPQSTAVLNPPPQISPSFFLQQRNSPYRPVHNVSTLLYPPPSGAMQQRPHDIELTQMMYQPLGKPSQHRQAGRLPYVAQNLWVDGNQPQEMTPVHQWPGFVQAPHTAH